MLRSIDQLPKQGDRAPWRLHQNYPRDILLLQARGPLEDEAIEFLRVRGARRRLCGPAEPLAV